MRGQITESSSRLGQEVGDDSQLRWYQLLAKRIRNHHNPHWTFCNVNMNGGPRQYQKFHSHTIVTSSSEAAGYQIEDKSKTWKKDTNRIKLSVGGNCWRNDHVPIDQRPTVLIDDLYATLGKVEGKADLIGAQVVDGKENFVGQEVATSP